jgi:hypothetical protein
METVLKAAVERNIADLLFLVQPVSGPVPLAGSPGCFGFLLPGYRIVLFSFFYLFLFRSYFAIYNAKWGKKRHRL